MSTYYYLLCDTHKTHVSAIRDSNGGTVFLDAAYHSLAPFMLKHRFCKTRLVSEHEDFHEYVNEDWKQRDG